MRCYGGQGFTRRLAAAEDDNLRAARAPHDRIRGAKERHDGQTQRRGQMGNSGIIAYIPPADRKDRGRILAVAYAIPGLTRRRRTRSRTGVAEGVSPDSNLLPVSPSEQPAPTELGAGLAIESALDPAAREVPAISRVPIQTPDRA